MKHNHLHISKDVDGKIFLFLETHNHDSNGYKLGTPVVDIQIIRKLIENLPDNYPKPFLNKRSFITKSLSNAGFIR